MVEKFYIHDDDDVDHEWDDDFRRMIATVRKKKEGYLHTYLPKTNLQRKGCLCSCTLCVMYLGNIKGSGQSFVLFSLSRDGESVH